MGSGQRKPAGGGGGGGSSCANHNPVEALLLLAGTTCRVKNGVLMFPMVAVLLKNNRVDG